MKLTEDVRFILNRLESAGYRADVVGGPVRDHLLGKTPEDYDITTSAAPLETKRVFEDFRTVDTGIKHGTVSLILNGSPYEITTYRIDGEYKDSRHPESVSFTALIEEDLSRRDFTMNAIAYNERDGITDPFGGREDIEQGIIRTVGDPERRFCEDALRILRGIRFASRLGFRIDEATSRAMHKERELLRRVSSERIYTEWQKLLSGDHVLPVLADYSDIIEIFLPEIAGALPKSSDAFLKAEYMTRLTALFYISGTTSEDFIKAMRRLRTDTNTAEMGSAALSSIGKYSTGTSVGIGRLLRDKGEDAARLTVRTEVLLGMGSDSSLGLLEDYLEESPYKLSHLRVGGNDLMLLGARGRRIGELLEELLSEVIDKKLENHREALLSRAESLLTESRGI